MYEQIGKKIRENRTVRGLTQEQLAECLNVSFQSISKWERGETIPDIDKLILLSRFLGVSVDELLGLNDEDDEEESKRITKQWECNHKEGRHKENEIWLKKQLTNHPNNYLMMMHLACTMEELAEQERESRTSHIREAIRLQTIILNNCTEPDLVNAARYNICFSFWKIGEKHKAVEMANKLPGYYKCKENALVFLCDSKQKVEIAKESLDPITWALIKHLLIIGEVEGKNYQHLAKVILRQLASVISPELYVRLRKEVDKHEKDLC